MNLAPTVVQAVSTFHETSTNADWSLVRQGPFALQPLVHEQQTAWVARNEHLNKVCHIHSPNKQFFEIGKLYAFSALDDELQHKHMTQNTAN